MKVTYNWLKDFVDIRISARSLADKLTMAGLEVTSLEERDGDFIFEIEVTANRPDCLSVLGVAREVSAITNKKLKLKNLPISRKSLNHKISQLKRLSIKIESSKDCYFYAAKIIENVKIGAAPDWLKNRLELIGCRSINSIVDITNYVLFELGEPLHAFDLDKVISASSGLSSDLKVIIRRAAPEEKIFTIDGIERTLDSNVLVIAAGTDLASSIPVAIAGIMGGKDTEVTEQTKNIILEAAIFDPPAVRKGRQKLGLQTESAYRFERGIDPHIVEIASKRAAQLIEMLCGGKCVLANKSGTVKLNKREISFDLREVSKILGVDITVSKIKSILINLGFSWQSKSNSLLFIGVPSHRSDVKLARDIIEEVARIFGYELIPKTIPKVSPNIKSVGIRRLVPLAKKILVGLGLNEVITYSLIERDLLQNWEWGGRFSLIEVMNALSKDQALLRSSIIPSLSRCVSVNLNQKQAYINIFEIGKIYYSKAKELKEELCLGIALCGTHSLLLERGLVKEEVGFLHLKGILETLFERLGIKEYSFSTNHSAHGIAVYIKNENIGILMRLPGIILERFNIKKDVFVAEIFLEKVFSCVDLDKELSPLPIYPGISRDISIILREGIALEDILKTMKDKGAPLLREAKVIDYYQGKQIPSGYRGLTISCFYRSDERTLTEAEVKPIHSLVSFVLADKFSAQIRSA